jgi:hypothetical protein
VLDEESSRKLKRRMSSKYGVSESIQCDILRSRASKQKSEHSKRSQLSANDEIVDEVSRSIHKEFVNKSSISEEENKPYNQSRRGSERRGSELTQGNLFKIEQINNK